MEYFDTHCHINDKRFGDDLPETIQRAKDALVTRMVVIGVSHETSSECAKIAGEHEGVYAAVGIQPNYAHEVAAGDWDAILKMLKLPSVVALGETGLDRHWDDCPFDIQQDFFDRHLRASQDLDVPFIVHMRECGDDVLKMLQEARSRGPLNGIMHSFTGDLDLMQACVEIGMHISFAGMVTFKKSTSLREVAAAVPDDRLLIETDAPYLSPEPKRKVRRNEPALVVHTAECVASTRGTTVEALAEMTTQNARRFFRV